VEKIRQKLEKGLETVLNKNKYRELDTEYHLEKRQDVYMVYTL
jgi:hypothetical protein